VLEARFGYLPGNWDIIWSLSVEEMFYLFFPIVCYLFGRGKLLVVLLLTFVSLGPLGRTVLANGNEIWREYSYLAGMDAIALGCLTALLVAKRRLSRPVLLTVGSIGILLLVFSLCFSIRANSWGLGLKGLNMTILALGTCMVIISAAQSEWRSTRVFSPFLLLGKRSYEIYLTHMFIVFGLFNFFVKVGKPMKAVPALFIAVILCAAVLGELVARFYSEPMNRWLRKRCRDGPERLGSVKAAKQTVIEENRIPA
jgi:peptidoglycan/LPS O-acetylase OafA/YrhL